jgi:regulator of RNase E activity RraB
VGVVVVVADVAPDDVGVVVVADDVVVVVVVDGDVGDDVVVVVVVVGEDIDVENTGWETAVAAVLDILGMVG